MRIFVNNVDGFLAGAICADLWKLNQAATIIGTRKTRTDVLVPPFIKKLVVRTDVRKLLKAVAACDVIVYDLHDADMEEVELVLRVLHASEITHQMTFILVSSVGVWGRTQRSFETVEASLEDGGSAGGDAGADAADAEAPADAEGGAGLDAAAAAAPARRPVPLKSEDYIRRIPAPKFQEWKSIETTALALRDKGTVHPYVVCAGIPYGNGEEAFLGLFKAAWQSRDSLRVIGDGSNFIPCVHVRDCARLVKRIVETRPELEYHLAVDRGDVTQREIVQAVATEFMVGYDVQSVTLPEALLAELADILTLDLRLEPSGIMEPTKVEEPLAVEAGEEAEPVVGGGDEEGDATLGLTIKPPVNFRWWSESGIAANISTVVGEFCRWRRLKPVRLLILGPPGSGANQLVATVAGRYGAEPAAMEEVLDRVRNTESPLGQSLKEMLGQIEAALNNPKAAGPFNVSTALMTQILEEAVMPKASSKFRGFVLSGFPASIEEGAEFFLEDGPVPEPLASSEDSPDPPAEAKPPEKILKASVAPDAVIVLVSSDEACQKRALEGEQPMNDKDFEKKMARWKEAFPEEGPKLTDIFSDRGVEPLTLEVDDVSADDLCEQIAAHLENVRPLYNFRVPAPPRMTEELARSMSKHSVVDDGAVQKEIEGKRKRKEEEDRLEAIKKEEFVRLEKHSEPLRTYLMQFVVPTLTTGLIDVCRETPEDPVAYLAEYLQTYSRESANARRRKRQAAAAEAAAAAAT